MAEVVSVKFKNRGKLYYFDPAGHVIKDGDRVVVETSKGLELGDAVRGVHPVPDESVVQPLRPVVRVATEEDLRVEALCRKREKEAFGICRSRIEAHGLDMKLVDVECAFEGNKILFFFSSDGRVDFRELVKDLAGIFRTRIELRQIGVRDEARMLGGLGICGRAFCCGTFLEDFAPVSTKMAKTQSMSLNPTKISGSCGRLMCCLRYEQEAYEELVHKVPKNGAFVETPDGYGNVVQVNILRQQVKVKLDGPGEDVIHSYDAEDVAAIPGGRPRDGSVPPHILTPRPKKEKTPEPPENSGWEMPQMLPEEPGQPEKPAADRAGQPVKKHRPYPPRQKQFREGDAQPGQGQTGRPPRTQSRPPQKPRPPRPENAAEGAGQEKYHAKKPYKRRSYKPRGKGGPHPEGEA